MRLAQGVLGIAGYLLGGLGAFSLLLGAWLASNTLSLAGDAARATGTVIGYRESNTSGGGKVFTPRVQFETESGTRMQFMGQVTAPIKRFAEGSSVPVIYRSSMPEQARIDGFVDNWLAPSVSLGLGVLSALAALLLVRSSRRALA